MSGLTSRDATASTWVRSLLFLCGALAAAVLFSFGSNEWPAFVQAVLFIVTVYCLFTSIGAAVFRAARSSQSAITVHTLLELVPLQAFLIDEFGKVQYVNAAFEESAGPLFTAKSSRDVFAVVHPEDELDVRKSFSEGIRRRQGFILEFRQRLGDGTTRLSQVKLQRIEEHLDGFGHWLGVLVEISDRGSSKGSITQSAGSQNGASAADNHNQDCRSCMENTTSHLTAILLNGHACIRFLSSEPSRPSSAISCVEKILRDAKDIARQVKELPPPYLWSNGSPHGGSMQRSRVPVYTNLPARD